MAQCPVPSNINPLSPVGFRLDIEKLPEVSYFCQEATLPDVTINAIPIATPLSVIQVPDTIITYGDLIVNFLIDEEMNNYKALYDWMKGLGFPTDHQEYTDLIAADRKLGTLELTKNYSDASLTILSSNNQAVRTLKFIDLFPISLASLQFGSNLSDVNYLQGNAIFRYTYYEFDA
jgi:hypothetical protein